VRVLVVFTIPLLLILSVMSGFLPSNIDKLRIPYYPISIR
jgi:hypothetical protein